MSASDWVQTAFKASKSEYYLGRNRERAAVPRRPVTGVRGLVAHTILKEAMIEMIPIGVVRSPIDDLSRDTGWGGIVSTIELDPAALGPAAAQGLQEFSHIQVLY